MNEALYVIWSEEHGAWWLEGSLGYTRSLVQAGRYSQEQALLIVEHANRYAEGLKELAIADPIKALEPVAGL
ncbi:MAG TPA: hypothetical protein VH164_01305 [Ktedonobacteraceae bacterium]|jgi:hypothetical protein|nr:hypothetical protein [Ktedonobacteraceae bacterium]